MSDKAKLKEDLDKLKKAYGVKTNREALLIALKIALLAVEADPNREAPTEH